MTLKEALDRIHALLEGDTDTPLTGEDYDLRRMMVNDAIEEWAHQGDVMWQELFATSTQATNGTSTAFSLPNDFSRLNGNVVLVDNATGARQSIQMVQVSRSTEHIGHGMVCWIEGDSLVFSTPPKAGGQLAIPYYRDPAMLTGNAQRLPMSKPRYVVHYVVARLVEQSGDFTRFNTNMQKAEEIMQQMKVQNDSLGEGVPDTVQSLSVGFGV